MLYRILVLSPFHCLVCNPNLNCTLEYEALALNMYCAHPGDASQTTRKLRLRHLVGQVCFRYSLRCSEGALHGSDHGTDTASLQGQLCVPLSPALHGSLPAAPAEFSLVELKTPHWIQPLLRCRALPPNTP